MALRRIARERFEPGECFVGWGVVRIDPSEWAQALAALASIVPGAGAVLAAEIARLRLLVLTDRRLWLIDPRVRDAFAPENLDIAELPLADVLFELHGSAGVADDLSHFEQHPFRVNLRGPGLVRGVRFTIGKADASRRLPEAFRVLARPREGPGGYPADGEAREPSTDRRPHPQ